MVLSRVCFSPGFLSQAQFFPERNLLQRASRTLERLFRGGCSSSSKSREDSSGGVLEARWNNLLCEKPFFSHVVSCDEIAPQKILLLEKSWLKLTQLKAIFNKLSVKTTLKFKINLSEII
jgi:hypothetical protein